MQHEVWKSVSGYEEIYEVSDAGRVRGLPRIDASGNWRRGQIMSQSLTYNGYPRVTLTRLGAEKSRKVHQLVLEAFCGPCPEGMEACHNNGKSGDCRLANLRWGTKLENADDKRRHGTIPSGERHYAAKLSAADIPLIARRRNEGATLGQIAAEFGVSKSLISAISLGQKWKHAQKTEQAA